MRSRVLNPRWIDAMRRHGYKGAFELAATVDYLFGYDATAHVVEDWMYERVTAAYVGDPEIRKFFAESNPWALRVDRRAPPRSRRARYVASLARRATGAARRGARGRRLGGSPMSNIERFPFSAVVGQDDAKLALLLAAIEPRIGGVLLRGQKGSAKTTLARGLAALLPRDSAFVELPLGATEDRVIGTLDIAAAVTGGDVRFHPGLLAAAHGGVLYVDEVNLLADHLVDTLLDVAVSGVNIVEREGLSHRHDAQFVLIGSMNPEEGELRPQLLDRFGLCVSVTAPTDIEDRTEVLRRRLAFDRDPSADREFAGDDEGLSRAVAAAKPAARSRRRTHRGGAPGGCRRCRRHARGLDAVPCRIGVRGIGRPCVDHRRRPSSASRQWCWRTAHGADHSIRRRFLHRNSIARSPTHWVLPRPTT